MNLQLWKVEEPVDYFYSHIGNLSPAAKDELDSIHHEKRRLEWLSVRWLLMNILKEYGLPIERLDKDEHGKPYLIESSLHLSISHAFPYVAAIVDPYEPTGVDIEVPKGKIIHIAKKFMHANELIHAKEDIYQLTLYWCAKEALYKIFGRKQLQFSRDLLIDPIENRGAVDINGKIIVNQNDVRLYQLHGHVQEDLVMVHKK
jgi:4'-phosphopantetheinyl transferase